MRQIKLTKRNIDNLKPQHVRFAVWDAELSGFGLRVTPSGERTFVAKCRVDGRQRWCTIGRHGPWTPDQARKEAMRLLGDAARGVDPSERRREARKAMSFAELCDLYLREGVSHKKASTIRSDRGRIDHHLKRVIGQKRVDLIDRADIERLLSDVRSGKTAVAVPEATRGRGAIPTGGAGAGAQCVTLASTIFAFAVERKLRADNPALGVKKPPVRKLERFLNMAELGALAVALEDEADRGGRYAVAAIKLLAFTGARRGEILRLRWREVDLERRLLNLEDSKTGQKRILLSEPAADTLRGIQRVEGHPFVFPGTIAGQPTTTIDTAWARIRTAAGLPDVRLHDLRHTFASFGASNGLGLLIVGKLLGHSQLATTQRYAHLADDPVRQAADAIGRGIAQAMGWKPSSMP